MVLKLKSSVWGRRDRVTDVVDSGCRIEQDRATLLLDVEPVQVDRTMPLEDLNPTTPLRPTAQALSTTLGEESVILNIATGRYFSLDNVGALVWSRLQQDPPISVEALEAAILARYDVAPDRCRRDLLALLGELHRAGLVELGTDEQAG